MKSLAASFFCAFYKRLVTIFICDSKLNFTVKKQEVDMPDMLNCHVYFNDQRQIKEFLTL